MATYRTKFQLTFDDVKGNSRTVEILKKNYFGQIYEMIGTGEPVVIKWENDDDFYNSIIGSTCTLNLLVTDSDNYDDFMNFDEREFKVRVSSGFADSGDVADIIWNEEETLFNEANNIWSSEGDVDIYWEGFLVADTYREQFISKPYVLTLTAIDGLGTLDAFDAPNGAIALDSNDNPETSDSSQSNYDTAFYYIYKILQNLDLNFDIAIQNKIRKNFSVDTLTIFHDIFLNEFSLMDNFSKKNAKEILENILRITNSRIYQANGSWYITSNANVYDERVVPVLTTTQLPFTPVVVTNDASSITNTSMTLNGEITDDFNLSIIERGFYFGTSTNYLNNTKTAEGGTTVSAFTASQTSLTAATTYYITAYASNSAGESVGATKTAITSGTTTTLAPTFNCLIAGLNINNGTVGETVTGTTVYGTINSISPSTYQNGNTVYTATIAVPSGYSNTGSTINCTDSATGTVPLFTCSIANVSVPNGVTGQTVTATLDEGTVSSITPSTYQSGTNTYTVRVNVPSGYSNTGSSIDCTDTATGTTVLPTFTCTDASLSIPNGFIGATVKGTVSEGTITSFSPSTYQSGSQTYTAAITVPSGYSNSGSSVNCTDNATGISTTLAPTTTTTLAPTTTTTIGGPVFNNTKTKITNIENTSMLLNASVSSNGGATLTERGFYFGTSQSIIPANKNVVAGTSLGDYSLSKTSLSVGVLYYMTPFASNGTITTFGTTSGIYTRNAMRVRRVSDDTIFDAQYNASFSIGDAITLSTTGSQCYVILETRYSSNAGTFPTINGACATTILPPTTAAPQTTTTKAPATTTTTEYPGSNIYIVSRLSDGFERLCQFNGSFAINTNVELSDDSINCYKIREEGRVGDNSSLPTITQSCTITTTTSNVTTTPPLTSFMQYRDCATGGLDQLITVGNTNTNFPEIIKNSGGECFFKHQSTTQTSNDWVERDYTSNFVGCNDCQGITTTLAPDVAPSFTSQPVITNVTADSMLISAQVSNFSQLNVTYKVHIGFSSTYTNNTSHLISTNTNSNYSISYNAQNLQPNNTYYVTIVAQTSEFSDVVSNTVSTTTDPAIFYKIYTQCNEGAGAVKYVSNQTSTFPNVIYDGILCYESPINGGAGQDGDVDTFTSFTDCATCEGQTTTTLAPTTTLSPCVLHQVFLSLSSATDACCTISTITNIYANNTNMDNATIAYRDSACTRTLLNGTYFTINGGDYYFWNGVTLTKSTCPACP